MPTKELKLFEDDMFKIVENVQFKQVQNKFQDKLIQDVKKINSSKNMVVFANTTRNLYELDKNRCEKLRRENITKT